AVPKRYQARQRLDRAAMQPVQLQPRTRPAEQFLPQRPPVGPRFEWLNFCAAIARATTLFPVMWAALCRRILFSPGARFVLPEPDRCRKGIFPRGRGEPDRRPQANGLPGWLRPRHRVENRNTTS